MEQRPILASSRFMLKRQASKRITKWRFIHYEIYKQLGKWGLFKMLHTTLLFMLFWTTILPTLVYTRLLVITVRAFRSWKIYKEFRQKSKRIRVIEQYYRSPDIDMNDMTTFVINVKEKLDFEAVKNSFEKDIVNDAMKCCLHFRYGAAYWIADEKFSIERQFFLSSGCRTNGETINEKNFAEYLGEMKSSQLKFPSDRPPWQIEIVPMKTENAYIAIMHIHSLLMKEQPKLMHFIDSQVIDKRLLSKIQNAKNENVADSLVKTIDNLKSKFPHFNVSQLLNKQKVDELRQKMKLLLSTFHTPKLIVKEIFSYKTENPLKTKRLLFYPKKVNRSDAIAVAWSQPISKQLIRKIETDSGAAFWDVILSCCSGSIHHYLGKYICNSPEDVTAFVAASSSLTISIRMRTSISDSRERLMRTTHDGSMLEKSFPTLLLANWAIRPQTMYKFLPRFIIKCILHIMHRKHALSFTQNAVNMEAVKQVFGFAVVNVWYWNNHSPRIGLHLSIVESKNHIVLCVQSKVAVAPEPCLITDGFVKEVNELAMRFGVPRSRSPMTSPRASNNFTFNV